MNDMQQGTNVGQSRKEQDEMGVIDLLVILAKHRKRIAAWTVGTTVVAAAVSFILPNEYMASAKLMPPQQSQSGAAALLSQLGGVAGMAAGVGGLKTPNDLYIGMLESRTVTDKLVDRFDLKKVFDTKSQELARKRLDEATAITSGKDGMILIEVTGRDKKLVAPIANAYLEELQNLTKVLAVTEAAQRRMFFERQLEQAKNNLANAEMRLKQGLDSGGVVSVDADSRAIVETIARLRAQVSAKEIQLNSMQQFVTSKNADFMRVEEELKSLRAELSKLENGRVESAQQTSKPGGLENIKVLRDVKYYQMLYELLAKQHEIARLDEAKDPAVIQVLDPAIEPEQKFKPKRSVITVMGAFLGFVIGFGWALASEAGRRAMLQPGTAKRWAEFKTTLRS